VTTPATSTGVRTLRPRDLREARDGLRDTGGALLFRGGGTKQAWGAPPERIDAIVSSEHLDALVDHRAGDMVAVVGAGMPLARLQAALATSNQWLALDPPSADEGATVGGLFAADDAGPRRQRYGSLRDLVIGVTVVLADGTVARAGGRVVKNVAGYDLMRLLCG
jgi:glycolate oxidase FAD binding subunit